MKTMSIFHNLDLHTGQPVPILSEAKSQARKHRTAAVHILLCLSEHQQGESSSGSEVRCFLLPSWESGVWDCKCLQRRVGNVSLWEYLLMCSPRDRTFSPRRDVCVQWLYLAVRGMNSYFIKEKKNLSSLGMHRAIVQRNVNIQVIGFSRNVFNYIPRHNLGSGFNPGNNLIQKG